MHRFVAILLLLLVPLRVFGAEAFGACMVEHKAAQSQAMEGMPDDCPMMAKHDGQQQKPAGKPSQDCSGCQLCMPLAGPDEQPAPVALNPDALPVYSGVHFRSADARRTLRPPIA